MDAFGASRSCTTSFSSPTPNWSRYYFYARISLFCPCADSPCFAHVLNLRVYPCAESSSCFPMCWIISMFPMCWIISVFPHVPNHLRVSPRADSSPCFPTCWISVFPSRAESPCFLTSWISLFPHVLNLRVSPHAESSSFSPRVESPDALNHIFL